MRNNSDHVVVKRSEWREALAREMTVYRKNSFGIAVALLLSGCVTNGTQLDEETLGSLNPGVTTSDEAIVLLGTPSDTIVQSDGTMVLQYVSMRREAVRGTTGSLTAGTVTVTTTTNVNFDNARKFTTYASSQGVTR